jgi:hypothetical protein
MDPKHVSSPVELVEKAWRGPILGVIKISAKAGFIAALLLAGLVGLIVYGISTAGHRRASNADGASLTKASEQQAPWWNAIPDAQPSVLRLPTIPIPSRRYCGAPKACVCHNSRQSLRQEHKHSMPRGRLKSVGVRYSMQHRRRPCSFD